MPQSITLWDKATPLNNGSADSGINWLENQPPSSVNNSARAMMERLAEFYYDLGAVTTVGGTADAITVTLNDGAAAYVTGQSFRFIASANNTTAVTLSANAIGAKAVRKISGGTDVALVANDLLAGETYTVIYRAAANAAAGAWLIIGSSAVVADASTTTKGIAKLAPVVCNGRLTLTSGTPVTTASVTAAGTLYFTPYGGNQIGLYASSAWSVLNFTEVSLALTLTSGKPYDIFGYNNAGSLALESLVWTDDTTRATGLTTQDGILVKSGDATRRFFGTIYSSGSNTTEDSFEKRFVSNYYNRVTKPMRNANETVNSYTYTTATVRQVNANTANQLDFVQCSNEEAVSSLAQHMASPTGGTPIIGVGLDSTTAFAAGFRNAIANISGGFSNLVSSWIGFPGVGRHRLTWLEQSSAAGTTTWLGNNGNGAIYQSGISGEIRC